ncbi:hypothetical protein [Macellibacteroides fermentans]|uniref:hypothetical protein n=1 Tax=Macellibacteroides fermentans TaxID=879969 RepID=UPI00406CE0D0
MEILTRIKTGFFEIRPYLLKAEEGSLLLIPIQDMMNGIICLAESDIRAIALTDGRIPELEIETENKIYSCLLDEGCLVSEVVNELKNKLNVNIICEYKGGKKHA